MEAVGAAASLTALLTLALQSAKFIQQTVSGFNDAPGHPLQLGKAASHLHCVLTRLAKSREQQRQSSRHPGKEDHGLKQLLQDCVTDLQAIQENLSQLYTQPNDDKLDRALKRVRIVLSAKKIERTWSILNHYGTYLGLHLGFEYE